MAITKWSPFRRIIAIVKSVFYVESGFLNLGSTAKCAEPTFSPAILNFSVPINTYLASSPAPLQGTGTLDVGSGNVDDPYSGEVLTAGQQSKSVGGTLSTTVTDSCNTTYTDPNPIYSPQSIWMQKVSQRYVQSSMYSGKLRLLVQAIYGSTRTDYRIDLDGGTGLPTPSEYKLIIKAQGGTAELKLEHGMPTAGLITTTDFDYYIMVVSVASITFYPLILTANGIAWRDILKTHGNKTDRFFSSRVEAYILSGAVPDLDNPVVKTTGITTPGTPIAYGFKFNWTGKQAKIILHETQGIDITSRTVTIDIDDALTVTASESTGIVWSHNKYVNVFNADISNSNHSLFGAFDAGTIFSINSCPIYGYYNFSGTFVQTTVSINITATNAGVTDHGQIPEAVLDTVCGDSFPSWTRQKVTTFDNEVQGTVTVNCNGTIKTFPYASKQDTDIWGDYIWDSTVPWSSPKKTVNAEFQNPTFCGGGSVLGSHMLSNYGTGAPYKWIWTGTSSTATITTFGTNPNGGWIETVYDTGRQVTALHTSKDNNSIRAEICLLIPIGDCESIVCGTRSWETSDQSQDWIELTPFQVGTRVELHKYDGVAAGASKTFIAIQEQFDMQLWYTNKNALNARSDLLSTTITPASYNAEIIYEYSGASGITHINEDGLDIISYTDQPTESAWVAPYFEPLLGIPFTRTPYTTRASANGASIVNHQENVNGYNKNGYEPGVISSIGWS